MRFFRVWATVGAALAFAQVVLGSWVRISGDGMACPDWPLCRGALVPHLAGGVVLEWTHRAVALTVGFVIMAAFVAGWRVRRKISGVTPTLLALVAVFVLQVIAGGITIHATNSPPSVVLHWACAMVLLATLIVLAVLARQAPHPDSGLPAVRPGTCVPGIAFVALLAYLTTCVGSYASSTGAGLACSTLPSCDGTLMGLTQAQIALMLHRLVAGAFVVSALVVAAFVAQNGMMRVRLWMVAGAGLALLQVALGMSNVVLRMPLLLREAHAANAALTFVVFVIATTVAMVDPLPVRSEVTRSWRTHSRPLADYAKLAGFEGTRRD
jgi:heme a synthase